MAPGGRSWAQIAAGIPVRPDAGPSLAPQDANPACEAAKATPYPSADVPLQVHSMIQGGAVPSKDGAWVAVPKVGAGDEKSRKYEQGAEPPSIEVCTESDVKELDNFVSLTTRPDALTETCFTGAVVPLVDTLVSTPSPEDACQGSENMSTAASEQERERADSCILCSGSGLLCVGVMSDPCPLCDAPGETTGNEGPEVLGGNAISDDSSGTAASESEIIGAEEASNQNDENTSQPVGALKSVASPAGKAISAPPGLGPPQKPPGVWIWPDAETKDAPESPDATKTDTHDGTINWPETPVDCTEVEFIGKAAMLCFGPDFLKMTVSWVSPWAECKVAMSAADLRLHLGPTAKTNLLAPLARLQAVLGRDQKQYQCQIFRMERSKDDTLMHMTCARVSAGTCWDVLKSGSCPRPQCTWEHPTPTLLNVSCAGMLPTQRTSLATLMSRPVFDGAADKIQIKELPMFTPSFGTMQFNLGAFDDFEDSSDDEA